VKKRKIKVSLDPTLILAAAVASLSLFTIIQTNNLKDWNKALTNSLDEIRDDFYSIYDTANITERETAPNYSTTEPNTVTVPSLIPGPQGERGEMGKAGELPKGHWEKYCLIDKEIIGYSVEGVMMRKSDGNCENGWKVVKIWEK